MLGTGIALVVIAVAVAFGNIAYRAKKTFDGDFPSGKAIGATFAVHGLAAVIGLIGLVLTVLGIIDYVKA